MDPGTIGTGAGTGAASGAMMGGPWGAVAGIGLGAGGAILNGMGADAEARRRQEAIDQYRRESARINAAMLQALAGNGQLEQGAQIQGITQGGAPAVENAAAAEQGRKQVVASRLATLAADQPQASTGATPATMDGSYTRAGQRFQLNDNQRNLLRMIIEQNRQKQQAGKLAAVPVAGNRSQLNTQQTRRQLDQQNAEAALQEVLGSTGNGSTNLQLLGALANMGSGVAFKLGANASPGTPTVGGPNAPMAPVLDYAA